MYSPAIGYHRVGHRCFGLLALISLTQVKGTLIHQMCLFLFVFLHLYSIYVFYCCYRLVSGVGKDIAIGAGGLGSIAEQVKSDTVSITPVHFNCG